MDGRQRRGEARERFLRTDMRRLDDREALELLLALTDSPRLAGPRARILLEHYRDLRGVLDAPIHELRSIEGLDDFTPLALKLVRSAASLYLERRAEDLDLEADASRLEALWRLRIGALANEVFEVAYLDGGNRLLRDGIERLQEGTIDRAVVYPRRVMESALRKGAAALVLAHNHPNGKLEPSEHDRILTRALVLAAETLDLKILDHLVVTADGAFSFKKAGLL